MGMLFSGMNWETGEEPNTGKSLMRTCFREQMTLDWGRYVSTGKHQAYSRSNAGKAS
jgi:hypothetical protein